MASWRCLVAAARTILGLAESRFQVVQREVAHLIFQAVEIHGCGLLALRRWSAASVGGGSGSRVAAVGRDSVLVRRVVVELSRGLVAAAITVELASQCKSGQVQCKLQLQLDQGRVCGRGRGERRYGARSRASRC